MTAESLSTTLLLPPRTPRPAPLPVIILHGGAFMLGHSRMNSMLQIQDCLERGWIVVAPNHRLCPQVNVIEGPISDCRDLLRFVQDGKLEQHLPSGWSVDQDRIVAMGTSAGGHLSYSLTFPPEKLGLDPETAPRPPLAILDFYGPKLFSDHSWRTPLEGMKVPPLLPGLEEEVFAEKPVAIKGGPSLEGQRGGPGSSSTVPTGEQKPNARLAWALNKVKNGKVLEVLLPEGTRDPSLYDAIDPIANITPSHPPTCIVHGNKDFMVPYHLSTKMYEELEKGGIECAFVEVEDEGHTFCGAMEKGSKTWNKQREGFDWLEKIVSR